MFKQHQDCLVVMIDTCRIYRRLTLLARGVDVGAMADESLDTFKKSACRGRDNRLVTNIGIRSVGQQSFCFVGVSDGARFSSAHRDIPLSY